MVFEGRARVRGPARGVNFPLATRRERQGLLISLPRYGAEKGGEWVKLKAISSQISKTGVGPYYHMGHLWMMSDAIPFVFEPFLDLTDTVLCGVGQESRSALFLFVVCVGERLRPCVYPYRQMLELPPVRALAVQRVLLGEHERMRGLQGAARRSSAAHFSVCPGKWSQGSFSSPPGF